MIFRESFVKNELSCSKNSRLMDENVFEIKIENPKIAIFYYLMMDCLSKFIPAAPQSKFQDGNLFVKLLSTVCMTSVRKELPAWKRLLSPRKNF